MAETRDWEGMRAMSVRLLEKRTGDGEDTWNRRIHETPPLQIGLTSPKEVDAEIMRWVRRAYRECLKRREMARLVGPQRFHGLASDVMRSELQIVTRP